MKTKKIALTAMCIALAMILSYVEAQLPSLGIPGVKMGLANIVVVFCLYRLDWKAAAGISLLRVLLVSILFGHAASLMYSAAGAALSLIGMILLKKSGIFGCVAVSVVGGVLHNLGQILVAWAIMGPNVIYYLPVLILSGTVTGVLIGLVSGFLASRPALGTRSVCSSADRTGFSFWITHVARAGRSLSRSASATHSCSRIEELLSILRDEAFCFRIREDFGILSVRGEVVGKSGRVPFCHSQIVHEVIAAVFRGGAGNALGVRNRSEGAEDQLIDLPGRTVALQNEVKAGQAAHRPPVNDLVLPDGIVPEEGGDDVLQRVHRRHIHGRLPVRPRQSNVIGRDDPVADLIHPAGKDAGHNGSVVNGKTRYQHPIVSFQRITGCLFLFAGGSAAAPVFFRAASAAPIICCSGQSVKRQFRGMLNSSRLCQLSCS